MATSNNGSGSNGGKNSRRGDAFGRDEMTAMLGGGFVEPLLRSAQHTLPSQNKSGQRAQENQQRRRKDDTFGVADLTAQETAAYLLEQQKEKARASGNQSSNTGQPGPLRHRRQQGRMRQYQLLAQEHQPQDAGASGATGRLVEDQESESEDEWGRRKASSASKKGVPKQATDSNSQSARRVRYDSDSSAGDDKVQRCERRRVDTSESEDESRADQHQPVAIKREHKQKISEFVDVSKPQPTRPTVHSTQRIIKTPPKTEVDESQESSSGESGSGSSSDDSGDSESEESEDAPAVVKPVFVPRHLRGATKGSDVVNNAKEPPRVQKTFTTSALTDSAFQERRKQESRALVQQVVTTGGLGNQAGASSNGSMSWGPPPPSDEDKEEDRVKTKADWEVREICRLLRDLGMPPTPVSKMPSSVLSTDKTSKQTQNTTKSQDVAGKRQGQRYYHKGAFYMDPEEWGNDVGQDKKDVRYRAEEYARAATGDDKIDKSMLPSVMRVKRFGFANQSKYKGLAGEDTTRGAALPVLSASETHGNLQRRQKRKNRDSAF